MAVCVDPSRERVTHDGRTVTRDDSDRHGRDHRITLTFVSEAEPRSELEVDNLWKTVEDRGSINWSH